MFSAFDQSRNTVQFPINAGVTAKIGAVRGVADAAMAATTAAAFAAAVGGIVVLAADILLVLTMVVVC